MKLQIVKNLIQAQKDGVALAAFNVPSIDVMRSIAFLSAELKQAVIIQTSAGTVKKLGSKMLKGWFDLVKDVYDTQIYLHLDHCSDFDLIEECIKSGWDMVMYDGSHLPVKQNLENTKYIAKIAHDHGVAVEAELGSIGGEEDGAASGGGIANIEEVEIFSATSGADCLAVGFGNVHGHYETKSNLRWDILKVAGEVSSVPLVLHGGTGLSEDEFRKAIVYRCAKVNISTAIKETYKMVLNNESLVDGGFSSPLDLHEKIFDACQNTCGKYIRLFSSKQ